jgi:hypothetical protein
MRRRPGSNYRELIFVGDEAVPAARKLIERLTNAIELLERARATHPDTGMSVDIPDEIYLEICT